MLYVVKLPILPGLHNVGCEVCKVNSGFSAYDEVFLTMTLPAITSESEGLTTTGKDAKSSDSDSSVFEMNHGEPIPRAVVGVGASAGGLEALELFFTALPNNLGTAYVVVQHLSPDFKSIMDELLARYTSLPISLAEDGMQVKPDSVYLLPPKKEMIISEGKLWLKDRDSTSSLAFPIDTFFRSLADDQGLQAIGVILSGSGSDGSRGIKAIHQKGGLVLVQDSHTAQFDGMPLNALATGITDFVLPAEEMPSAIQRHLSESDHAIVKNGTTEIVPNDISRIYSVLHERYHIDFSAYKTTTVYRRIVRRQQIVGCKSLEEYIDRVVEKADEQELLYKDLLIGVTRFFRDTEAFEILKNDVIPSLLEASRGNDELRIWSAACASGEEAYSLAILFADRLAASGQKKPAIKIFATDIHPESLEVASRGAYPLEALEDVDEEIKRNYFRQVGDEYVIDPAIRSMIVFAQHNLLQDAPFTRMDFVSCRNLLIYFKPLAQKRVISFLHFSLCRGGILFLGSSESMGDLQDEFIPINKQWKIFQKKRNVRLVQNLRPKLSVTTPAEKVEHDGSHKLQQTRTALMIEVYDSLLATYIPESILIDPNGQILHLFQNSGEFLHHRHGRMTGELLDLVYPALQAALSPALIQAKATKKQVIFQDLRVPVEKHEKKIELIDLHVHPILSTSSDITSLLVIFKKKKESVSPVEDSSILSLPNGDLTDQIICSLQAELKQSKENHQATIEELEASNEELQAANEELVASNEELQSTNEELHSVNEELYTVNAEYQRKIGELTELTIDMDNLLKTSELGIMFLDEELKIRKFTPQFAKIFQLLPQDIGRPLRIFRHAFDYPELISDIQEVAERRIPLEKEIRTVDGKWYLFRVNPYLAQLQVKGVVLSLVDISASQKTQASLKLYSSLVESSSSVIFSCDLSGTVFTWNRAASELFQVPREQALGAKFQLLLPEATHVEVMKYLARVLRGDKVDQVELSFSGRDDCNIHVVLTGSPLFDAKGVLLGAAFIMHNVTERNEARQALQSQEALLRSVTESVPVFIWMNDPQGRFSFFNRRWASVIGDNEFYHLKNGWLQHVHEDERRTIREQLQKALQSRLPLLTEFRLVTGDDSIVWMSMSVEPRYDENGEFLGLIGSCFDVTARKEAEQALRRREQELADFFENATVGLHLLSEDGIITRANPAEAELLGYPVEEYVGQSFLKIYENPEEANRLLQRLKAGEILKDVTSRLRCKDGSYKDVVLDASVLWSGDTYVHARCFVRDVTEQRKATEIAQEAVRRRDQFLAVMSHELRNPLGAIRNAVQVLLTPGATEEVQARAVDVIGRQGNHMGHLLSDLLDVSRITQGKIELERSESDLCTLIQQTLPLVEHQIAKARHNLELLLPDEPIYALVDACRFTQIVENLLTNAIKYTNEGGLLKLRLSRQGNEAVLQVEDNGVGIESSFLETIFEPFFQLDETLERAQSGMGLGLTLSASLVHMHQGSIKATSNGPGQGACFTVKLPLIRDMTSSSSAFRTITISEGRRPRVVIIEDNRDSKEMLEELLGLLEYEVYSAGDGVAGLALIEEVKPDFALVDVGLPKLDGYEIGRRLKTITFREKIFLIALTGYGTLDDREKCRNAGFDYHLVKPVDFAELQELIQRVFVQTHQGE
jgi:two-component system, chemotaxis family, CheB/CheR fusion protein